MVFNTDEQLQGIENKRLQNAQFYKELKPHPLVPSLRDRCQNGGGKSSAGLEETVSLDTARPLHIEAQGGFNSMHKTCVSPSQTKPSTRWGAGDATISLAVELLTPVNCWERETFSLR